MRKKEFNELLSRLDELTPKQRVSAVERLTRHVEPAALPMQVKQREQRLAATRKCVHCGASGAVKNGKSAGLTRFRCKASDCGKTWTALTGTGLARLRKRDKWESFQACLRNRMTLAKSAERCGMNIQTAFKWRHRMVSEARPTPKLDGVVEIDETYFYENEKGRRKVRQRRKPRKRGGGDRFDGTVKRPVLTAVARGNETIAWETHNITQVPVRVMLNAVTSENCVVVSDAHATFKSTY